MGSDKHIRGEMISKARSATCPRSRRSCQTIHDHRPRVKRDVERRGSRVHLVLWKRRVRCVMCRHPFPEEDHACGSRRRTTAHLREAIGHQVCSHSVAHVAQAFGVAQRVVQDCCEQEVKTCLEKHGMERDEIHLLETPPSVGLEECSRRKGHRDETSVADVKNRTVLAIGSGRTVEDVQKI